MVEAQDILKQLLGGRALTETQAEEAFDSVLSGAMDGAQISAMLALIAQRGPTVDELVGGARAMRRKVLPIDVPRDGSLANAALIDTCGTGGAPKTFNVSTIAAIVTAAAAPGRVMVAKHGGTSRTGRGSSEVLRALGVDTEAACDRLTACLRGAGVCFCAATRHHPAMRHAAGARKSLGFPTIFNLLGPLTNPAGADRQLVGTYDRELAAKIAETLARLGVRKAVVVTSGDGLDELTTTDTNFAITAECGRVTTTRVIDARELGFPRATLEDLRVRSLEDAAVLFRSVLDGTPGAARDMVLLNAAAALFVADVAASLPEGVAMAAAAVDSGRARATLDRLVRITTE